VIAIEQMPWIRRGLCRIRENEESYFLTYKTPETNHVDLFNFEQQKCKKLFYRILDSKIYVLNQDKNESNFCQIFDRLSMIKEAQISDVKNIRTL
jgi:hypothetical protein